MPQPTTLPRAPPIINGDGTFFALTIKDKLQEIKR
jgi:hypothetical protein